MMLWYPEFWPYSMNLARVIKHPGFMAIWEAFLDLCDDPGFRQVVVD